MANWKKLAMGAAGAAGGDALNVENVFSTTMYDGNSSTQTITNGIDLSTEGGLVWTSRYENAGSSSSVFTQQIYDTERGVHKALYPATTSGQLTYTNFLTAFNTDGFTVGNNTNINYSGDRFISWTWRKAPKFFDVVTYTGNGTAGRTVGHNLDSEVGMLIVKETSSTGNWWVYHRGVNSGTNPAQYVLQLSSTTGQVSYSGAWNNTAPTTTSFTLGNDGSANQSGASYVAYLWAHNDGDGEFGPTGDQDIIKCGYVNYTTSNGATVDLGFEPQFVMTKAISTTSNWIADDEKYGLTYGFRGKKVDWGTATGPGSNNTNCEPTANGFNMFPSVYNDSTHVYVAVRRGPMAAPTDAADVFNIASQVTTPPNFRADFPIDMAIYDITNFTFANWLHARPMAGKGIGTDDKGTASTYTAAQFDYSNGYYDSSGTYSTRIGYMWRRSPEFFEIVNYTGTGSNRTIDHNLGITPEMMIIKNRDNTNDWWVYHKDVGVDGRMYLNDGAFGSGSGYGSWVFNSTAPTSTQISLGTANWVNSSGNDYIAFLFGSISGVSKVGSYSGNGSSQTIDCGFSNGARFVLIKGYSGYAQGWFLFDTLNGIVTGDDPHMRPDLQTSQITGRDLIDPTSSGFIVNQETTSYLNHSSSEYVFYAIAA